MFVHTRVQLLFSDLAKSLVPKGEMDQLEDSFRVMKSHVKAKTNYVLVCVQTDTATVFSFHCLDPQGSSKKKTKKKQAQLLPKPNASSSDRALPQPNTCKCTFLVDYFAFLLFMSYNPSSQPKSCRVVKSFLVIF